MTMKPDVLDEDDIVIAGVGCKLPEVDNLPELAQKLFGEKVSKNAGKNADFL